MSSFEDLFKIISENRIFGFGKLAIYDTALRIGYFLRLYPEQIYLHAGTSKGAKKLGIKINKRKKIEISELPKEFHKLNASEIEDILCIFKDRFQ